MDHLTELDVIATYTRANALADGALIDVTADAQHLFRCPVAVTAALWSDIQAIPAHRSWEDVAGRLWDVLWMAFCAIKRTDDGRVLVYDLILHVEQRSRYQVKLVAGPGDDGELVITLMCPDEE